MVRVIQVVRRALDWLAMEDYERAKQMETQRIVRRQSRGNVNVQNGWYMTRDELLVKSRKADAAMGRLRSAFVSNLASS